MRRKMGRKVKDRFSAKYKLHNVEGALNEFYSWRDVPTIASTNAGAHFWDFVKSHYFTR